MHVIRIGSSGAYTDIPIQEATWPNNCGWRYQGNLITNADTGALFAFERTPAPPPDYADCPQPVEGLATITGTTATVTSGVQVPGMTMGPVVPALQAEDGSFVGWYISGTWDSGTPQVNTVAFDASGSVLWTVQNEVPMIAIEDGIIAQSGTAYDQNGNAVATDKARTTAWNLNSYQIGSVDQTLAKLIRITKSWWPFSGGNSSGNSAATQQPWYAALQSCPGTTNICPQEAIMSALAALKSLAQSCTACQYWVFDKLSGINQSNFSSFLSRPPRFWDGTKSYAPANVGFCPGGFFNQTIFCNYTGSYKVRDYILGTVPNTSSQDAMAQTPADAGKGMQVFFHPDSICNALSVSNPQGGDKGVLNQAVLFHEALHGATGSQDITLQSAFGLPTIPAPTVNITYYLEGHVIYGAGASTCGN
ncbi:MAG: hypothetical protein ABL995_21145 [Bryobacteraceae bacterium]